MCGEMAGDPTVTKILLGLAWTNFPSRPPPVPKVKRLLRDFRYDEAKQLAQDVLQSKDQESVLKRLSLSKG